MFNCRTICYINDQAAVMTINLQYILNKYLQLNNCHIMLLLKKKNT